MPITRAVLSELGVTQPRIDKYLPALQEVPAAHGIDTDLRVAHFLAQVLHESGDLKAVAENLNYTADRLRQVFGDRFTPAQARRFAGQPERIANRAYARRLGNGDEASGDGFRFRGRGLIQLTGKGWYRQLSEFVGEDLVAAPELVASRYAVHSAAFFWVTREINAAADADDVATVTRLVNGNAMHGLARRTARLEAAKAALSLQPQDLLGAPTHRVTAVSLNLRSRPLVRPSTRVAVLSEGSPVVVLGAAQRKGWVRVRTLAHGRLFEGVVHGQHLAALTPAEAVAPIASAAPAVPAGPAPTALAVHLTRSDQATRAHDGKRAFPLGEPSMPRRRASAQPEARAAALLDIVRYLDSQKRAHKRYWPRGGTTFCNIYAHDYCHLAGAYLPRVWWKPHALADLLAGGARPAVRYDSSVRELNANALLEWLGEHGPRFGWQREPCLDVLQASANDGGVCVIVARHRDANRSGHVVAVVPEHAGQAARRDRAGRVLRPLESQAGSTNHRFLVKSRRWWEANHYRDFAFFRHA